MIFPCLIAILSSPFLSSHNDSSSHTMIFRFNPSLAVFCWRYCGAEGPAQSDHLPAACAGDKTWKSHLIYFVSPRLLEEEEEGGHWTPLLVFYCNVTPYYLLLILYHCHNYCAWVRL